MSYSGKNISENLHPCAWINDNKGFIPAMGSEKPLLSLIHVDVGQCMFFIGNVPTPEYQNSGLPKLHFGNQKPVDIYNFRYHPSQN